MTPIPGRLEKGAEDKASKRDANSRAATRTVKSPQSRPHEEETGGASRPENQQTGSYSPNQQAGAAAVYVSIPTAAGGRAKRGCFLRRRLLPPSSSSKAGVVAVCAARLAEGEWERLAVRLGPATSEGRRGSRRVSRLSGVDSKGLPFNSPVPGGGSGVRRIHSRGLSSRELIVRRVAEFCELAEAP